MDDFTVIYLQGAANFGTRYSSSYCPMQVSTINI